ncbi:MAG: hypothetical protein GYB50_20495 [Rhodobacteraceae bacterium]|nr:hypothetical protein [Paracoccaceae bacterium]
MLARLWFELPDGLKLILFCLAAIIVLAGGGYLLGHRDGKEDGRIEALERRIEIINKREELRDDVESLDDDAFGADLDGRLSGTD